MGYKDYKATPGAHVDPTRNLVRFDSVAALGAFARAQGHDLTNSTSREWSQGESGEAVLPYCATGKLDGLDEARRLMAQLTMPIASNRRIRKACVAGSSVCVPDYLAGSPMPMRRTVLSRRRGAPVRIFVAVESSAVIPASTLVKRGCTALALALTLHAQRPVELFTVCAFSGHIRPATGDLKASVLVTRIPLGNVSLSVASLALCNTSLVRNVQYCVGTHLFQGGDTSLLWANFGGSRDPQSAAYIAGIRSFLGLRDDDLFIPAPHIHQDAMNRDPLGWIKDNLAKLQDAA